MAIKLIFGVIVCSIVSGTLCQDDSEQVVESNLCESSHFPMTSSVNHLGFSMAKELGQGNNANFFFSPLGLSTALGVAYMGSRGLTARQFEEALQYKRLNITGVHVHENMYHLTDNTLQRAKTHYTFNMANALFGRSGLKLDKNYTSGLEMYYNASAVELDFTNEPIESLGRINEWVRDSTSGKISNLADEPLPADTQLLLTNAIYFKGAWKVQFSVENTVETFFYVAGENKEATASMMALSKETFRYLKDEQLGYKFLELPYEGEEITMMFALPLKHDQVPDIEMTSDLFCRIRMDMNETELDAIAIPRFRIEYEKNLKSVLTKLGLSDAFSPGSADFSAMKSGGGIYISDVVHKAVVEVNEQGSEAAAVSGLLFRPVSAREVDEFVANHSFLFYIVDAKNGVVLFSGRVMEP